MRLMTKLVGGSKNLAVVDTGTSRVLIGVSDAYGNLTRSSTWGKRYGSATTTTSSGTPGSHISRSGVVMDSALTALNNASWQNMTGTPGAHVSLDHVHGNNPPVFVTSPLWRAHLMQCRTTYANIGSGLRCDTARLRFAVCGMFNCGWSWLFSNGNWYLETENIFEGMEAGESNVRLCANVAFGSYSLDFSWSAAQIAAMNVAAGNTASTDADFRRKYSGWVTSERLTTLVNAINLDPLSQITVTLYWDWDTISNYAPCYPCDVAGDADPSLTTKLYTAQQPEIYVGVSS